MTPQTLPPPLIQALQKCAYRPGTTQWTATSLLSPPQKRRLEKLRPDLLQVEDPGLALYSVMGNAIHDLVVAAIPPESDNSMGHVRFTTGIPSTDQSYSAEIDIITMEPVPTIWDIKNVFISAAGSPNPSHVAQLNLQAYAVRQNTDALRPQIAIEQLKLVHIFRDWHVTRAASDPDYPQSPFEILDVELWPDDMTADFAYRRWAAHQSTDSECDAEERWMTSEKWQALKIGGKVGRNFPTAGEAQAYVANLKSGKPSDYTITLKPRTPTRCLHFCAVSSVCPTHTQYLLHHGPQ